MPDWIYLIHTPREHFGATVMLRGRD